MCVIKKMKIHTKICLLLIAVFTLLIFSSFNAQLAYANSASSGTTELITTRAALKTAIDYAESGSVIEIGDVDFYAAPKNPGEVMPIVINKSITIKSGNSINAILKGHFAVKGSSLENEKISVNFVNIDFIGTNNPIEMGLTDGDSFKSKFPHPLVPVMSQNECVLFSGGFVDATFQGCAFSGYASAYGTISARYTEKSSSGVLSLNVNDCTFNNNAANIGAALYLYCTDFNIRLNADKCRFYDNIASKGGALYANQAYINLKNCNFRNMRYVAFSEANELFKGGGAVCANESKAVLINSKIINNQSYMGGGLCFIGTSATVDGCVIAQNNATRGGAIYSSHNENQPITILNCSIYKNKATADGGGLFVEERDELTKGKTTILLSSIGYNTAENIKSLNDAQVDTVGCLLIESTAEAYASPSAENDYNATGTQTQLLQVGVVNEASAQLLDTHLIVQARDDMAVQLSHPLLTNYLKNGFIEFKVGAYGTEDATVTFDCLDDALNISYGNSAQLPTAEKSGYNFVGWFTEPKCKGAMLETNMIYAYGQDIYLYGGFERIFPTWGIALIVLGGVTALVLGGFVVFCTLRRKKLATTAQLAFSPCETDASASPVVGELIFENVALIKNEYKLSAREAEVVELLLVGKSTKKVAEELFITFDTVRFHCKNIYKKLSVHSQAELISFCQNYIKK